MLFKKTGVGIIALFLVFSFCLPIYSQNLSRDESKRQQLEEMQKDFEWWPTDATPAPNKDSEREGYWWWPTQPGQASPWGNRGYVYVYKIIFDYKAEELPPPEPQELRPSLLIKKIIKNVKIYFDYDSAALRDDAVVILKDTVMTLSRNPKADILITGNCDRRGSEKYNENLGRQRAETVQNYMRDNGIPEESIRIISRGKLDAVAPLADLVGMQKDRNAHFVIAEVEEVMIPFEGESARLDAEEISEGKYLVEEEKKIEGEVRVDSREYVIKKGDTLSKIALEQLGKAHRWKYLYELNKDVIKDPNKLRPGKKIMIPIE